MKHVLVSLYLLGCLRPALPGCDVPASAFQLPGDYLLGGLFDVHHASGSVVHHRPVAINCSRQNFTVSSYRMFQVMRFSVEEINNSTTLLPNVSLGYEISDHCSDTLSFPGVLNLISVNGSVPLREEADDPSRVIAVVGPFGSTETLTVAPLFMINLIPMVSYGSASSVLTNKWRYPSFLRTVHSNEDIIDLIVRILQYFDWRWVAFLHSNDAYGEDGLELFRTKIHNTEIYMPYTEELNPDSNYSQMFREIESLNISTVIVFSLEKYAKVLIESAIACKVREKVWIAGDSWSLNQKLSEQEGIHSIGTILGVAEAVEHIPGFHEFIGSSKVRRECGDAGRESPENPSYSFPVYSAVYAIAHALHNVLRCHAGGCREDITVYPHMVLAELKKSNFTLLNVSIGFDEHGEPLFGSHSVVFWNRGHIEEIGVHDHNPLGRFSINSSKIRWHTNGKVPVSECSPECAEGFVRKRDGIHRSCFTCEVCPRGTYMNSTEDPYRCVRCQKTEWSAERSISCSLRSVEFVSFTDGVAVVTMLATWAMVGLSGATAILFAANYHTPVVRSAGGPMCFLILGCLSLSGLSVFFYFGKPTTAFCILRYFPFLLCYATCMACFMVRSFQIVCVFKMAAKFPKLHGWWMRYNGQWLVITAAFVTQALMLVISYTTRPPRTRYETLWYPDQIVLGCGQSGAFFVPVGFLWSLCFLCFVFSYMGKDLPKNYNEAKAKTFCLLLLIFTWILFATVKLLYHGKHIQTFNALAVLSSLYSILIWYFLPKCYIIVFQPHKNTQQYFQGLIQSYTKNISK
ncbi:taste receptor type 1 member 1-like [Diretmus argenteus]